MIEMRISKTGYTDKQRELLSILKSNNARKEMNQIILDAANKYIPTASGKLRESGYVYPSRIGWSAPYAHYQYQGEVYGPNIPVLIGGNLAWRSPKHKYPTGRELGAFGGTDLVQPRFIKTKRGYVRASARVNPVAWTFGYNKNNPRATHHWFRRAWTNDYRSINNKITRKLKDIVRSRTR